VWPTRFASVLCWPLHHNGPTVSRRLPLPTSADLRLTDARGVFARVEHVDPRRSVVALATRRGGGGRLVRRVGGYHRRPTCRAVDRIATNCPSALLRCGPGHGPCVQPPPWATHHTPKRRGRRTPPPRGEAVVPAAAVAPSAATADATATAAAAFAAASAAAPAAAQRRRVAHGATAGTLPALPPPSAATGSPAAGGDPGNSHSTPPASPPPVSVPSWSRRPRQTRGGPGGTPTPKLLRRPPVGGGGGGGGGPQPVGDVVAPDSRGGGCRRGMGCCRGERHGGGVTQRCAGQGTASSGLDARRRRVGGTIGSAHPNAQPPPNIVDGGQGKRKAAAQPSRGGREGREVGGGAGTCQSGGVAVQGVRGTLKLPACHRRRPCRQATKTVPVRAPPFRRPPPPIPRPLVRRPRARRGGTTGVSAACRVAPLLPRPRRAASARAPRRPVPGSARGPPPEGRPATPPVRRRCRGASVAARPRGGAVRADTARRCGAAAAVGGGRPRCGRGASHCSKTIFTDIQ